MNLSSDIISQFVKAAKGKETTKSSESTVFGTTVEYNGSLYVKLDGSDQLTPISTTAKIKSDERVVVMIKDHTATVTGNISSPSASNKEVEDLDNKVADQADQISEFEILISYRVTTEDLEAMNATIESLRATVAKLTNMEAVNAEIENLEAKFAELEYVSAKDVEAINADIEHLEAAFGEFTDISTEDLEAINANISQLKGYTADFTYVSADVLTAIKADIVKLDADKLSANQADLHYVNIDFSNIDRAWMQQFYAESGLIENVTMGDGTVTGYLVGVTIKGDLIEAGTLVADKLVIQGEDGLYYKLNTDGATIESEQTEYNSLDGSHILAKSITATKISVDDLVAFGATIGGFHITSDSIYSGVKSSVDNTTRGIYMDNEGQLALGDSDNFIKYYRDNKGKYQLSVSSVNKIKIGTRNLIQNSHNLIFDDYYFSDDVKVSELTVEHDDSGNVTISSGTLAYTHDEDGNVTLYDASLNCIHDGNGNVTLMY